MFSFIVSKIAGPIFGIASLALGVLLAISFFHGLSLERQVDSLKVDKQVAIASELVAEKAVETARADVEKDRADAEQRYADSQRGLQTEIDKLRGQATAAAKSRQQASQPLVKALEHASPQDVFPLGPAVLDYLKRVRSQQRAAAGNSPPA